MDKYPLHRPQRRVRSSIMHTLICRLSECCTWQHYFKSSRSLELQPRILVCPVRGSCRA